jgi:hypothetical protein
MLDALSAFLQQHVVAAYKPGPSSPHARVYQWLQCLSAHRAAASRHVPDMRDAAKRAAESYPRLRRTPSWVSAVVAKLR